MLAQEASGLTGFSFRLLKICLDYEIFMTMELIQKQNLVRVHF